MGESVSVVAFAEWNTPEEWNHLSGGVKRERAGACLLAKLESAELCGAGTQSTWPRDAPPALHEHHSDAGPPTHPSGAAMRRGAESSAHSRCVERGGRGSRVA